MKTLFGKIPICFIFFTIIVFSQTPESKINELMSAYNQNGQFNGTAIVKKGDKIIFKKAFGYANREWDIKNEIDSKFLIGSIGKPFTALMTLILVNDGVIDLNAKINTYIPEYSGPAKNAATIHQLLTHTSGIPDHGAISNYSKKRVRWIYNSDQYLELINEVAPKFEPGTGFAYSGIAYNILAIICERAAHKEFGDLLNERIFTPLKMADTKLDKNLDIDTRRASGYEYHLLEGYMNPSFIEMCHVKGSGGILSTVEDLAKFSEECFRTQKLIAKSLYAKMFTPFVKDWQYYGYGWWITNKVVNSDSLTLISHGGSTDGYKAYLTRIVQDSTDIILLQNNYYRTELGVKFDYATTNEIIGILHGKEYKLPKRSLAKELGYTIGHEGIEAVCEKYYKLKDSQEYFIDDEEFQQLAKELNSNYKRIDDSRKIYELALQEYPKSFLLNFSYGEFLAGIKDKDAEKYFDKCVALYPAVSNNEDYKEEYEKAVKWLRENR